LSNTAKVYATKLWRWFRGLPLLYQMLLLFPVGCAIALTLTVGNMGLALMGTAIAINSVVAGWIGGVVIVMLGKAGIDIIGERRQ
jgi:hypothetical protein